MINPDGTLSRVTMEPAAQRAIVDLACGEPFLFQLAGARAWYSGNGDCITVEEVHRGWGEGAGEAEAHVQRILDRLPAREREFLDVMTALEPQERTLTAIAHGMGFDKAADAGPTSQRLDTARRIISRGKPYGFQNQAVEAFLTTDWPNLP